jgi:hypothetical protein
MAERFVASAFLVLSAVLSRLTGGSVLSAFLMVGLAARPLSLALLPVGAAVLVGPSLVTAVRGHRALPAASSSSTAGGC